jgi:hypothetical protein
MELLIRKNPGCECPRTVGVAITDKNGFLDAFHNSRPASSAKNQIERYPIRKKDVRDVGEPKPAGHRL